MSVFKNLILSCALSLTLIAPARASIGFTYAGPVIFGAAMVSSAAISTYGGYRLIRQGQRVVGTAVIISSLFSSFWGFVLLDGEQEAMFAELTEEAAQALGIPEEKRAIYNSEVDQVNAIAREIGLELERLGSADPELARDLWIDLGSELSAESMDVVISIASQQ